MTKKIVAVMAVAFALGAFADTWSWFDAKPTTDPLPGSWSAASPYVAPTTQDSKWVIDSDWADDIEKASVFTPTQAPTGTDNKRCITVKAAFGAAYAVSDLPSDLTSMAPQAGLVIAYDPSEAEVVSNYYGLVGGDTKGWKKLTGADVPADLSVEVPVTVEIDYTTSKVTYKVDGTALNDDDVAFSTDTRLESVGFSGCGTVAEISGGIDWKMVNVTIGSASGATLAVTNFGVAVAGTSDSYSVVEGSTVYATYTADATHFFGGEKTTTKTIENAQSGSSITAPTATEGVANYNSTRYLTVQAAVGAAGTTKGAEIEVVLNAEETLELAKDADIILTTVTNKGAEAVFKGTVKLADGATEASLLVKQGYFNFGTGITWTDYLATGFFVTATDETTGVSLVGPGTTVVVPESGTGSELPAQNLEPTYFNGAKLNDGTEVKTEEQKIAYLEEVPTVDDGETSNGLKRWQNEALGINKTTTVPVEAPQTGDSSVTVALDVAPSASSGLTVQYVVGGNIQTEAPTFDLGESEVTTGTTDIKVQLVDENGKAADVKTIKFGVMKKAAQKAFDMVPVAFANVDGTPVTVANLVKTANLTAGDTMHVLNSAKNGYDTFELVKGSDGVKSWTKQTVKLARTLLGAAASDPTAPENYTLTKGQAVWLERSSATEPIITYGAADTATGSQTLAAGMNLVANPKTEAVAITSLVTGAADGDQIIINDLTYTYNGSAWTYVVTTTENTTIRGKSRQYKKTKTVTLDSTATLPAGQGFWYNAMGGGTTLNW